MHAGTGALNVVPGSCEIDFNLRFAPVSTAEALKKRIEEHSAQAWPGVLNSVGTLARSRS